MTRRAAGLDIAGAEKKLRHARLLLGHLKAASEVPFRRAGQEQHDAEAIECYFSACLSAAQSVHTVLEETGGPTFQLVKRNWLKSLADERERSAFKAMKRLRGEDVHFALTRTTPLPKYVAEDRTRDWSSSPYYQRAYHAALFGPAPVIQQTNPDGTPVVGSVLSGAVGLYLEHQGRRIEVPDACAQYIDQLASLVEAVKAHIKQEGGKEL